MVGGGAVDAGEAAAGRAGAHRRIDHVGQPHVAGEAGRAVELGRHVEPGQRLAGQAVGVAAADRQVLGQVEARRRFGELGEGDAVGAVPDEAVMAVELPQSTFQRRAAAMQSKARAPAPASRIGASKARIEVEPPVIISAWRAAKSCAAQRPIAVQEAGQVAVVRRLLGEQPVGVERRERRRLDRDRAPVGAELVGEDLRQRRPHALAQLGLRHRDGHPPVGADLEKALNRVSPGAARRFGA